jgi:hypothetical protein
MAIAAVTLGTHPCTGKQRRDQVLDWSRAPFAKWFVGGKLNVAYNCVDRHVTDGHGEQVALPLGGRAGRHPHYHLRRPAAQGVQGSPIQRFPGPPRVRIGRTQESSIIVTTPITTPFGAQATDAEVVAGIDLSGRRAIVTRGASASGTVVSAGRSPWRRMGE